MSELNQGTKVNLTNGQIAVVENELGRGGRAIVYAVDVDGKKKALWWYICQPGDNFYRNLGQNIKNGAPSSEFLWPQYLTEKEHGSFGYVMDIRPKGYFDFSSIILAKHNIESYHAMLVAAMEICEAFKALHTQGLCFHDFDYSLFLINPNTGMVIFPYSDEFFPYNEDIGYCRNPLYNAPEVVLGQMPNLYSDRFMLSVILFMLFFGNHPFEGAKVTACPCMTEQYTKKFYGTDILFIFDPEDQSNHPVQGLHTNVINIWPDSPEVLRQTFISEFRQVKTKPQTCRLTEDEWIVVLDKLSSESSQYTKTPSFEKII